jgi:Secretion system C-terminal sorting domain
MKKIFTLSLITCFAQLSTGQFLYMSDLMPNGMVSGNPVVLSLELYEPGLTNASATAPGAGVNCELYHSPVASFGGAWTAQIEPPMSYAGADNGNNDVFQYTLSTPGFYEATCRCRIGTGPWQWKQGTNVLITVTAPLAAELTSLNAKRQNDVIQLTWATATESNHDRFVVERAGADMVWAPIHEVKSDVSESKVAKNYTYNDVRPLDGTNHYRLRMVGLDGQADYSKVVVVARGRNISTSVYPNPVSDRLFVDAEAASQLVVYNALGLEVLEQSNIGAEGMEVTSLPTGTYLLVVKSEAGDVISTQKFMKQ